MKPIIFSTPMVQAILDGRKTMTRRVCRPLTKSYDCRLRRDETPYAWLNRNGYDAPYHPGDVLWVRETWHQNYDGSIAYKASAPPNKGWKPSIYMPREAARIFLRVTDVGVERVQDITDADAMAEGFEGVPCDHPMGRYACEDCMNTGYREPPTVGFAELWDRLNAKRGYGWDANPWVWVISFDRIEKPEEGAEK